MSERGISQILAEVNSERLRQDMFRFAQDPLPFRKVNHTCPGHARNTLEETDFLLREILTDAGLRVSLSPYRVQAFRCDSSKPLHHWYAKPDPEDPWYMAGNIEAEIRGCRFPDEIIQLVSHKDSMS